MSSSTSQKPPDTPPVCTLAAPQTPDTYDEKPSIVGGILSRKTRSLKIGPNSNPPA